MKAEVINCPNPAIEIAAEPAAGKKTDRDVPVNTDKRNDKALRMTENKFEKSNFQSDAQINIFKGKITKNLIEFIAKVIFTIFAFVAVAAVISITVYMFIKGLPALGEVGIAQILFGTVWAPTAAEPHFGILYVILTSLVGTAMAIVIGVPIGLLTAVFLAEVAPQKLSKAVKPAIELLAGIPSIVYGLFGMLFFVMQLKWGYSLIAGAFTLAIMVLPVIMRTTEEALLAVPDSYREGSFGLGAGKLRTVFTIVLPSAMPGILSGVILATGRIVGETAALIYTASTVAAVPASVFNSTRTLATHMYLLSNEGLHINETYGTAVVLLILVLLINSLSSFIAGRLAKK